MKEKMIAMDSPWRSSTLYSTCFQIENSCAV